MLDRFINEPALIVKKSIAEVIGALSSILIPNKEWNELFLFIKMKTDSGELIDK